MMYKIPKWYFILENVLIAAMLTFFGISIIQSFLQYYRSQHSPKPTVSYFITSQEVTWEVKAEGETSVSQKYLAGVCRKAGYMAQEARLWKSAKENYRQARIFEKANPEAKMPLPSRIQSSPETDPQKFSLPFIPTGRQSFWPLLKPCRPAERGKAEVNGHD